MIIPRLGIVQMNPVVGDFLGNAATIIQKMREAAAEGLELLVFGELALCGYPLGDLSYRQDFISEAERALQKVLDVSREAELRGLTVVLGTVTKSAAIPSPQQRTYAIAHNSAVVFRAGSEITRYHKRLLPTYDVFDDWRNFIPGEPPASFQVGETVIGLAICEDIWTPDPALIQKYHEAGVGLIVAPNGSPFTVQKPTERREAASEYASGIPLLYVNLFGGQDELVFDGDSFLLDSGGNEAWRASNDSNLQIANIDTDPKPPAEPLEQIWEVLKIGLADYLRKTSQSRVVLGLSGGIDSALCAVLAVDAIGADNVLGVRLPSRYSSKHSLEDAATLATNLGIELRTIPIDPAHTTFETMLSLSPLAAENLQARLRAVTLMAISNSEGYLLLSTGNKSEIAVGYSTIYGDAAGGFAPIKDVYKTLVWQLARWRNTLGAVIPESSISKPPSAELRPNQKDADSLPDYMILDGILRRLIEESMEPKLIVAEGFDTQEVARVDALVRQAEWKRSQGAIGTKITRVSFGRGRRVPIATTLRLV